MTLRPIFRHALVRSIRPSRNFLFFSSLSVILAMSTQGPSRNPVQVASRAPDGAALFEARCIMCHGPGMRATQLSALSKLSQDSIYAALKAGIMQPLAQGLGESERRAIAAYLAGNTERNAARVIEKPCKARATTANERSSAAQWNGWSQGVTNARFQKSPGANLAAGRVPALRLSWAFVFPDTATAASQPTIVDDKLYIGSSNGSVYSLDSKTGCAYWTYSVIAMDLRTGEKRWVKSFAPDRWNLSCSEPDRANCPPSEGPDSDFGSSPILCRIAGGREMILAGQKSGVVYALDPDKRGEVLWQVRLGRGGILGGIEWGMAGDAERVYVAVSDWNFGSSEADAALNAVDLETGRRLWRTANPADTCRGRDASCSNAQAAAVTAIPGVVFSGSTDGHLRAYDTSSGRILWDYDTTEEVLGVNGLNGRGGSINGAGVTVVNGMLYQTSGYGMFGMGMPGNVLLAFGASKTVNPVGATNASRWVTCQTLRLDILSRWLVYSQAGMGRGSV